jgi:hypothetical protein
MLTCFTASIASSIAPTPIAMAGISWFLFYLGMELTIPVFVSCLTSYCLLSGSGILQSLQAKKKMMDDRLDENQESKIEEVTVTARAQSSSKLSNISQVHVYEDIYKEDEEI